MSSIFPSTGVSSADYIQSLQQSSDPSKTAPNDMLDQADFLRLLTAQLMNQDPTKPMDPTDFISDLTQMSQLEATTQMNASVLAMTEGFQSLQVLQGAALIGKSVQAEGEEMSHIQGVETKFQLDLRQPLTDVTVVISDGSGLVRQLDLGNVNQGEKQVAWNGVDNVGAERSSGQYRLTVFGTDANGELQSIQSIVPSRVNSVGINPDGSMHLTLATGEKVALEAVREISK